MSLRSLVSFRGRTKTDDVEEKERKKASKQDRGPRGLPVIKGSERRENHNFSLNLDKPSFGGGGREEKCAWDDGKVGSIEKIEKMN
jgi:hypothetical protein